MKKVKIQDLTPLPPLPLGPLDHDLDIHVGIRRLIDEAITGAPVVDGGNLVGIISMRDIMRVWRPSARLVR